jgi:hypothetical protein
LVIALALFAGGPSWAKGKPGGGNGGGGGGSAPTGTFYAGSCHLVQAPIGWTCVDDGNARMNTSGEKTMIGYAGVPNIRATSVSHDLHAGERIMLTTRVGTGTNPDGSPNTILVAVTEDGTTSVDLTNDGVDRDITAVRWAKDDSFASFIAVVWDGAGVASNHVLTLPVVFGGDGLPSPDDDLAIALTGSTYVDSDGKDTGTLAQYDWSPDGTRIVYTVVASEGAQAELKVFDGTASSSLLTAPEIPFVGWSPAAGSERIFYFGNGSLNLIDSDGTDGFELATSVNGWWGAAWSPDGSHLAFIRWNTIRIKGSNVLERDLMTIAATGGQETKISGKDERVWILFGWVD